MLPFSHAEIPQHQLRYRLEARVPTVMRAPRGVNTLPAAGGPSVLSGAARLRNETL